MAVGFFQIIAVLEMAKMGYNGPKGAARANLGSIFAELAIFGAALLFSIHFFFCWLAWPWVEPSSSPGTPVGWSTNKLFPTSTNSSNFSELDPSRPRLPPFLVFSNDSKKVLFEGGVYQISGRHVMLECCFKIPRHLISHLSFCVLLHSCVKEPEF